MHGTGGDPCLCRSSRASAWRSPLPPPQPAADDGMLAGATVPPPNCRGSITWRCCIVHEGCTIGSKSEDRSYVAGIEDPEGRSAMERGGGIRSG